MKAKEAELSRKTLKSRGTTNRGMYLQDLSC